MLISVIIPTYQSELYIGRCISSILKQSFLDYEIIIINDGSTDNTLTICEQYARHYPKIKVFSQENKGLIEARKRGLSIASGDYILFVDSDDWISNETLELLNNIIKKDNPDMIFFRGYEVHGTVAYKLNLYIEPLEKIHNDCLEALFNNQISPTLWFKLTKKSFLIERDVKFPSNISYAEDVATTASYMMHFPKISFCPNHLYYYFQHSNSLTHRSTNKVLEVMDCFDFMKKELQRLELFEKYKDYFYKYCDSNYDYVINKTKDESLKNELTFRYSAWRKS